MVNTSILHRVRAAAVAVGTFGVLCCPFGQASQRFQSVSDKLLAGALALPSSGTVSLMVNPHFSANDGLYHIFFEVMQPVDHGFQIVAGPGILYADWNRSGYNIATAANTMTQDTWANVLVTWVDGGTVTVYLNGKPIAAQPNTTWIDTTGYTWSIGNRTTGGFDARSDLAQLGVWNRVLTPSEIAVLGAWALPSVVPSGLIAEYDMTGSLLAATSGTAGPLVASGPISAPDLPPPPSPMLSLSGPTTGTVEVPVYFALGETYLAHTTNLLFSDGGAGGTFSILGATLTADLPFAGFAYTNQSSGTVSISMSNDQGIANPAPVTLRIAAIQPQPILSVDFTAKTVQQGSDATFAITQAIPNGYTSGTAALRVFNVPAGFGFAVNGVDCGRTAAAIAYFNWNSCGVAPAGTYTLTVHTGSLDTGVYFFNIAESDSPATPGSGLTLQLTVN